MCVAPTHALRSADLQAGLAAEKRSPPSNRTHAEFVAAARANEAHEGKEDEAPAKETGVKLLSPLHLLPLFDLVWDICADYMHIHLRMWSGHTFPLFRGTRTPAAVRPRQSWTDAQNTELMEKHEQAKEDVLAWKVPEVLFTYCRHLFLFVDIMSTFSFTC